MLVMLQKKVGIKRKANVIEEVVPAKFKSKKKQKSKKSTTVLVKEESDGDKIGNFYVTDDFSDW